jgi:hypothetical protein
MPVHVTVISVARTIAKNNCFRPSGGRAQMVKGRLRSQRLMSRHLFGRNNIFECDFVSESHLTEWWSALSSTRCNLSTQW